MLTKSTEPYGIYVGVPGKRKGERFTVEEVKKHKKCLEYYEK